MLYRAGGAQNILNEGKKSHISLQLNLVGKVKYSTYSNCELLQLLYISYRELDHHHKELLRHSCGELCLQPQQHLPGFEEEQQKAA